MRFLKFKIENFKGIRKAEIHLSATDIARVYTLVGLNESGKTTLLEALHSFSPDSDTEIVVGSSETAEQQRQQRVPRHRIADFTGAVSVQATIACDEKDKADLSAHFAKSDLTLDLDCLLDSFTYERLHKYENGNYKGSFYKTSQNVLVKSNRQRKFRSITQEESHIFSAAMSELMPAIAYFPTFVFDFPERIYLSRRNKDKKNEFYRKLFQDILDYSGRGHTIDEHIVSRIRKPEHKLEWFGFLPLLRESNEQAQIDQVIDVASKTVTSVVYRRWNEIFKESTGTKEIQIIWNVEKGLMKKLEDGSEEEPDEHDIYISFQIKDGTDRFPIKTRSLGFRWFFSFLLFTQFRAGREAGKPLIFLFDEPASNLHAAAQQKLIESFNEIAKPPHMLIYSTHSHYMIEPKWLEQAYIVQNDISSDAPSMIDSALIDDSSVNVKISPYRRFVNDHPNLISYFQPIIDRLDVVPSKFDMQKGGIVVEGKSDYYILQYLNKNYTNFDTPLLPALGAGTMGALIGLLKGWGIPVRIILDSDKQGNIEKEKYKKDFYLSDQEITTISEFHPSVKKIEDLFSEDDKNSLSAHISKKGSLSKKEILAIFQENLAANKKLPLTDATISNAKEILEGINAFYNNVSTP